MRYILPCVSFFLSFLLSAQPHEHCAFDRFVREYLQQHPDALSRWEKHHESVREYLNNTPDGQRSTIIKIPVVFHVIHSGEAIGVGKNISQAQIESQIEVLNECYRKRNADTALVPSWFKDRIADVGIEFCLAQYAPNGTPTTGITRHQFNNTNNFDTNIKPLTQWDHTRYLNIWTTVLNNTILGYATPPGLFPNNQDGVVIDYRYVGRAPANPFNTNYKLGKTAVHEVGHWLGLFHTFQDSCAGNTPATCALAGDRICDTPPTKEANYGSPSLTQNTCIETPVDEYDMWMNYMDYTDDENLYMFTLGQRDVMRATLFTTRLSIQSSLSCTDTFNTFTVSGRVVDAANTNVGIPNAKVLFDGVSDFETTADANGYFTINGLYEGHYDIIAGKWGCRTSAYGINQHVTPQSGFFTIPLKTKHYYDDFTFNFNWNTSTTASNGLWTRATPIGTTWNGEPANPSADVPDDYSTRCFVTGNAAGPPATANVDNGSVILISPSFDLTGFNNPYIRYRRWFFSGSQNGNTPDDQMVIRLNNGSSNVILEAVTASENQWVKKEFRVSDYIPITNNMRITIEVSDLSSGNSNLVEGGFDVFEALNESALPAEDITIENDVEIYPNPTAGKVYLHMDAKPDYPFFVYDIYGREVFKSYTTGNNTEVDLTPFPQGIYLLQTGAVKKILKIVRQ
ncbi:MAG: M43 family zinc metalloprotease [Chitinophagales bacterium]|nr:M43 family zinc metalloprotease [Chitinophagales bacterium]MDW8418111.1 M43 family zinc metalloprotease [Chitinophagales bacterium]